MAKKKAPSGDEVFRQFKLLSEDEQRNFLEACELDTDGNYIQEAIDSHLKAIESLATAASALGTERGDFRRSLLQFRNRGKPTVKAKCRELRQQKNSRGKRMSYGEIAKHPDIRALTDGKGLTYQAVSKHCKSMD